jgi:hypothetical protein
MAYALANALRRVAAAVNAPQTPAIEREARGVDSPSAITDRLAGYAEFCYRRSVA